MFSENGEIIWDIDLTPGVDEEWAFMILNIEGSRLYLLGSNNHIDSHTYLLPVNENGDIGESWDLGREIYTYASANDGEELIFYIKNDEGQLLKKYRSDGELVFQVERPMKRDWLECKQIYIDEMNDIYLFASEGGDYVSHIYVTKYSEFGDYKWSHIIAGRDYEVIEFVEAQYRGSGEFYVSGVLDPHGWSEGTKTVLLGMDSDGNRQWIHYYHPENAESIKPLATTLDENGDLFVAGTYSIEEEEIDNVGGCGC